MSRRDTGRFSDYSDPSLRRRHSVSPLGASWHPSDVPSFLERSSDRYRQMSPQKPLRPLSPRYPMHLSPRARTFLPLSDGSVRDISPPRPGLRPRFPRLALRPLLSQGFRGLPRMSSPPLLAAFDREHGRHAHEGLLAGRGGHMSALTSASSLGAGTADVLRKQEDETLSGSSMLVSRSIVMNDGTVGTFYVLPPDPPLQETKGSAFGGQVLPPLSDVLSQYNSGPIVSRNAIDGDFLFPQDQRPSDRSISRQSHFAAVEKSLSDHPLIQRDQPQRPHEDVFNNLEGRRFSQTPLPSRHGVFGLSNRNSYVSELQRGSRRMDYENEMDSVHPIELPLGERYGSPYRYRKIDKEVIAYDRGERNSEIPRVPGEGRTSSVYPLLHDLPRQPGLARSPDPRQDSMFDPRDVILQRHARTPPRDELRRKEFVRDDLDYGPSMHRHLSPRRNVRMSPRRMRSLSPPKSRKISYFEEERRAWKRKFIEMGGVPFIDHRTSQLPDPASKKREKDICNNSMQDRRPSGWDRRDGWPERRGGNTSRTGKRSRKGK
ncbi:hypothetical protein KP509_21G076500 [Ceratopteris richardii]|nr:hypothetical protein KP509_21G076500 [Ceratopteris richardii]